MASLIRTAMYVATALVLVVIVVPMDGGALDRPEPLGALQIVGAAIILAGSLVAFWSVLTFAMRGRGTPLPFDPPRRLVLTGPYALVRNPMAIGVGSVLLGVAIFYQSAGVFWVAVVFFLVIHAMVVLYEEPTLRRTFGDDYAAYCARTNRWIPGKPNPSGAGDFQ